MPTDGKNILKDGAIKYYYAHRLHNEEGPAVIYPNGEIEFWDGGIKANHYKTPYGYIVIFRSHRDTSKLNKKKPLKRISKVEYRTHDFKLCDDRMSRTVFRYVDSKSKKYSSKIISYLKNERFHRDDGPAEIYIDSSKVEYSMRWYQNGALHRNNGPAVTIIYPLLNEKLERWHQNYNIHREDGPAEIITNLTTNKIRKKRYLIKGFEMTEEEFNIATRKIKIKNLLNEVK